jgi:hypothetical protein
MIYLNKKYQKAFFKLSEQKKIHKGSHSFFRCISSANRISKFFKSILLKVKKFGVHQKVFAKIVIKLASKTI